MRCPRRTPLRRTWLAGSGLALALGALAGAATGGPAQALSGASVGAAPRSASGTADAVGTSAVGSAAPAPSDPVSLPRRLPVAHPTLWLCRPGLAGSPCVGGLDATVVRASGSTRREPFRPDPSAPVDCFYVYPTVSKAPTTNAPLTVTPELVGVVRAQAARFTAACRLYAPVYRQVTLAGLFSGGYTDPAARALAHADVVSAWHDYLNRFNRGRPFVLIGHSQGALELTRLIQEEIDGDPVLRARLQTALLMGGPVTTAPGRDLGGSFQNIPACRSRAQTGCVVAYASYPGRPPSNGIFGRTSLGQPALCVNPARPAGGRTRLLPYVPTPALVGGAGGAYRTGFVAYPDAFTGACRRGGGFTWLQVRATGRGPAPDLGYGALSPAWGYHRADVTLALGDLVRLVRTQAAAGSGRALQVSIPQG